MVCFAWRSGLAQGLALEIFYHWAAQTRPDQTSFGTRSVAPVSVSLSVSVSVSVSLSVCLSLSLVSYPILSSRLSQHSAVAGTQPCISSN